MPIQTLTSLFRKSGEGLPGRITTSRFQNRAAMDFIAAHGLRPVPGEDVSLKAILRADGYRIMAHYSASVQEFTPYSVRLTRAEKTKVKMLDKLDADGMLRTMAAFEAAGRGHKLTPDNIGNPPRMLDGSTHIFKLLKNPKIMARIRPRLYAASRMKKMRKDKGPRQGA